MFLSFCILCDCWFIEVISAAEENFRVLQVLVIQEQKIDK